MHSNFKEQSEVIAKSSELKSVLQVEYNIISLAEDPSFISHLPYLNP